jgi:hypothetical protein
MKKTVAVASLVLGILYQGSLAFAESAVDEYYREMDRIRAEENARDDEPLFPKNSCTGYFCEEDKHKNPRYDTMKNESALDRPKSKSIGGIVADQLQPR